MRADSKEEIDEMDKLCDGLELLHLTCLEKADSDASMNANEEVTILNIEGDDMGKRGASFNGVFECQG